MSRKPFNNFCLKGSNGSFDTRVTINKHYGNKSITRHLTLCEKTIKEIHHSIAQDFKYYPRGPA